MPIHPDTDYFSLFGLPIDFDLDETQLSKVFLQFQAEYHPDRFVNAQKLERRVALQTVAWVNEAYNTLKDPLQRGFYLLKLAGYETGLEQKTSRDASFLMRQMTYRERLDDARSASDPLAVIDELKTDVAKAVKALMDYFKNAYETENWNAASDVLIKWQFYTRLESQIAEKEADIEDELFP